jgi:hypothetical protein
VSQFYSILLVVAIALVSVCDWILLLARRKIAALRESMPVWLPEVAVAETGRLRVLGLLALGIALAGELSGEAHLERAAQQACACGRKEDAKLYVQATEQRFNGVRRCC